MGKHKFDSDNLLLNHIPLCSSNGISDLMAENLEQTEYSVTVLWTLQITCDVGNLYIDRGPNICSCAVAECLSHL